ncbi:hypothetical protein AB0N64_10840 [Microbacterium sp. NPDC089318]
MNPVRYPRHFEIYRLEALGDEPWLSDDEAREQYEQGRGLTVIPADEPVSWSLDVSSNSHRLTVSFHTAQKKLVRRVAWEQVDGMLFCRHIIDRFYPAGEDQLPLVDVITVTQDISTDGIIELALQTAGGDDEFTQVDGVDTDELSLDVPEFGDWHPIVEASRPTEPTRVGDDATAAARTLVERVVSAGSDQGSAAGSMWRVPAEADAVVGDVEALMKGGAAGIPILIRGEARIAPLAVQLDAQTADTHEQRHRVQVLAYAIDGACEYRAGRGIRFDLDQHGADEVSAYAAALRAAGAAEVTWWELDPRHGVTLVWTGDESRGDLALALHLVPIGWVSDRRTQPASGEIDVRWGRADVV